MTRAQLLALTSLLTSLGAGVYFVSRSSGAVDAMADAFGALEVVDRSQCTTSACNATQCQQAQNVLDDAGLPCTTRFIDCPIRVGQRLRSIAADAGVSFGPQKYQQVRVIAERCAATGGGFALGIPVLDNGWPVFAVATGGAPGCVRAPVAGGTTCQRDEKDGGSRYFGAGNVFPVAEARGSGCEAVGCTVFYGDDSAVDL